MVIIHVENRHKYLNNIIILFKKRNRKTGQKRIKMSNNDLCTITEWNFILALLKIVEVQQHTIFLQVMYTIITSKYYLYSYHIYIYYTNSFEKHINHLSNRHCNNTTWSSNLVPHHLMGSNRYNICTNHLRE